MELMEIYGTETEKFINEKIKSSGIGSMDNSRIIRYLVSDNRNFISHDLFTKKKSLYAYYIKKIWE